MGVRTCYIYRACTSFGDGWPLQAVCSILSTLQEELLRLVQQNQGTVARLEVEGWMEI